ncbi:MAG: enhanced serine sensitivity protein SseB C-terminal domain-containing protein [Solirubrobacteraceae bacterium]
MAQPSGSNELERLLVAAANDPAERPAFAQALLTHDVYVPGRSDPPPVNGVIPPDAKLRFATLEDARGSVLPFFTSQAKLEEALAQWPGADPAFLCLPARALLEITRGSRLALNPNTSPGKEYTPQEVAALLDGRESGLEPILITEKQEVLVGAPRFVPPELPAMLARFFVQRPVVEAAHLGWWRGPGGDEAYLLGVVALNPEAALEGFGQLGLDRLTEGRALDIQVFEPGAENGILDHLPPPFYIRAAQADVDSP